MHGRVAIVTGGAYGIGRGIVRHFAKKGLSVLIADVNAARGHDLTKEILENHGQVVFEQTDVRDEPSVERLMSRAFSEWGRLDILCNNAGIERYRIADEYTSDDWDAIVNTNLRGPFLCSKYAIPLLRLTKGSIINIASVQAICCEQKISVYAASKAGLLALTRGMALDYASQGIRVNAICPGAIHAGMLEEALSTQSIQESAIAQAIPLGRIGTADDIAAMAYFLTSAEASYITGASFVVDGGVLSKLAL